MTWPQDQDPFSIDQSVLRDADALCRDLRRAYSRRLSNLENGRPSISSPAGLFPRLDEVIESLSAMRPLFSQLLEIGDRLAGFFEVWWTAIDVLVQAAERASPGRRPLTGPEKADFVRSAVEYLLRDLESTLDVQPLIRQFITTFGTDWVVDATVTLLNQYGGWTMDASTSRGRWRRVKSALLRALLLLLSPLTSLIEAIDRWHQLDRLPPDVVTALVAAEHATGAGRGLAGAVDELETGIHWFVEHRKQLVELVSLIGTAVQIVETYEGLSGPEKRRVIQKAMVALFRDLGPLGTAGVLLDGLEAATGVMIDSVVGLFNRRNMFAAST